VIDGTTMSVPTNGQATPATLAAPASKGEVAVWTVVVLATSLVVYPGLGIVIAAVLAFSRLRHNPTARWVLLGVAVAILIVQIIGIMAGSVSGSSSPGVPVG
jgi:chromate transport protein ChrA